MLACKHIHSFNGHFAGESGNTRFRSIQTGQRGLHILKSSRKIKEVKDAAWPQICNLVLEPEASCHFNFLPVATPVLVPNVCIFSEKIKHLMLSLTSSCHVLNGCLQCIIHFIFLT